jgi:hypothetical protein
VKRRKVLTRLSSDGNAELDLTYEVSGASAASWRARYAGDATRRARVLEDLSQQFPGVEVPAGAITLNDVSNYEQPVSLRVHARAPHLLREEGGSLSSTVTPRERLVPVYASAAERHLDVDIGSVAALEEHHEITLPAGLEVKSVPPNAQLETRFGKYSLAVQRQPGKVIVDTHLELDVSRVTPADYAEFRRFCQAADAAFEPRLVLGAHAK